MQEDKTIEMLTKELETAQGRAVIARIYAERANLYRDIEDYENAIKDYEKVLEYEPQNPKRASIHRYIARIYKKQENFDKAEKEYTLAIETYPDSLAYLERGEYYKSRGETEKYEQDFQTAIDIEPTNHLSYQSRAERYERYEEYVKAINDYTKAIELAEKEDYPAIMSIYYDRAQVCKRLSELDFAEAKELGYPNSEEEN